MPFISFVWLRQVRGLGLLRSIGSGLFITSVCGRVWYLLMCYQQVFLDYVHHFYLHPSLHFCRFHTPTVILSPFLRPYFSLVYDLSKDSGLPSQIFTPVSLMIVHSTSGLPTLKVALRYVTLETLARRIECHTAPARAHVADSACAVRPLGRDI